MTGKRHVGASDRTWRAKPIMPACADAPDPPDGRAPNARLVSSHTGSATLAVWARTMSKAAAITASESRSARAPPTPAANATERGPPAAAAVARVAPAPDATLDTAPERTSDDAAAASGPASADSARAVHAVTFSVAIAGASSAQPALRARVSKPDKCAPPPPRRL